jgi:hypothetical protein
MNFEEICNELEKVEQFKQSLNDAFEKILSGKDRSQDEKDLLKWHIADVFGAASATADVCGKEAVVSILEGLRAYFSSNRFWIELEAELKSLKPVSEDSQLDKH